MSTFGDAVTSIVLAAAFSAQMARWLRVLQREHYDPRSLTRFLGRWSAPPVASANSSAARSGRRSLTLSHVLMVAAVVAVLVHAYPVVVAVSALYGLVCPVGLSLRGRTSPLRWTPRLRLVASGAMAVALVVSALSALSATPYLGAVVVVWAVPPTLDVVTRLLTPLERRRAQHFVTLAQRRLDEVRPRIVAITGSYGKTSTKNYLAQVLHGDGGVISSPRSFNNRAGLSRAVNENLVDGTRVFIAEMGTYGPGEIRELTQWLTPEIAVVTAIGPVHLERMGSLDTVEAAKREITERAATVVLNIDDPRLATWVNELTSTGRRVVTAGSTTTSDVQLRVEGDRWTVDVAGRNLGSVSAVLGVHPTNLACALAVARELGVADSELVGRAGDVTPVASRLNVVTAPSGVVVLDDTFNANPASARVALDALTSLTVAGRRVVVTPGLVELGAQQYVENVRLGERVASAHAELVVVGRTNALPLSEGFGSKVVRFDRRDGAVAWVRKTLRDGDAVLYLNDLPDHYP